MDRYKATGKVILPDGTKQSKSEFRMSERFIDYGPEDVQLLLWCGVIREELETLFYVMGESMFRSRMDSVPIATFRPLTPIICDLT